MELPSSFVFRFDPATNEVDVNGNIFSSSQNSVQVFAPDGTCLGEIHVPETVTNLTFGGPEGHCLFITAGESLYTVKVKTRGLK
jgi:gluconolactonase